MHAFVRLLHMHAFVRLLFFYKDVFSQIADPHENYMVQPSDSIDFHAQKCQLLLVLHCNSNNFKCSATSNTILWYLSLLIHEYLRRI